MSRSSPKAGLPIANERFKQRFGSRVAVGIVLATAAHAAILLGTPYFAIEDVQFAAAELASVDLPPDIEIPPPPQAIPRPAAPVIAVDAEVDESMTIAPTTFDRNPVETLPPPPSRAGDAADIAAAPVFTPMTVRPELKNPDEVAKALLAHYPRVLKDAGIGGKVQVWFFIDETGCVVKTQVHHSSGIEEFDQAALKVAHLMEFSPAYNRDKRVPVWVSLTITFEARPAV